MIRHIVFFKVRYERDRQAAFEGLQALNGIPERRYFEIGCNLKLDSVPGPTPPDFVVYGEFDDEAQLDRFKAHPLYEEATKIVRPLRDLRMAVDFIAGHSTHVSDF